MTVRFKNLDAKLDGELEAVLDQDACSDADGHAVPYGIYNLNSGLGFFAVSTSADTPAFAVTAVAIWSCECGRACYSAARGLVILTDGAGSNGWCTRTWKTQIQHRLCDSWQRAVAVAYYPSKCFE